MKFDFQLQETQPIFDRIRHQTNLSPRIPANLCVAMLCFLAVYLVCGVLSVLVTAFLPANWDAMVVQLYATTITTAGTIFYCCFVERRPLRTMGFTKHRALPDYLLGMLLGIAALGASVMLAWGCGAAQFDGIASPIHGGMLLLLLGGWLLQGLSEEVLCRGFLLCSIGAKHRPWTAVLVSALEFAALHLGNDFVTPLALCNLTLYGIFAALLFLRTDSIWMAAAFHSLWNCAQGNLFGVSVSGMQISDTILRFSAIQGKDLLSGGGFGMEGGLAVTIVLLIGNVILLCLPNRTTAEAAA